MIPLCSALLIEKVATNSRFESDIEFRFAIVIIQALNRGKAKLTGERSCLHWKKYLLLSELTSSRKNPAHVQETCEVLSNHSSFEPGFLRDVLKIFLIVTLGHAQGVPKNWWILVSWKTKSVLVFSCAVLSPGLGKRLCCTEKCTDKEQGRLWPWQVCSWSAGGQVALGEETGAGGTISVWKLGKQQQDTILCCAPNTCLWRECLCSDSLHWNAPSLCLS